MHWIRSLINCCFYSKADHSMKCIHPSIHPWIHVFDRWMSSCQTFKFIANGTEHLAIEYTWLRYKWIDWLIDWNTNNSQHWFVKDSINVIGKSAGIIKYKDINKQHHCQCVYNCCGVDALHVLFFYSLHHRRCLRFSDTAIFIHIDFHRKGLHQ